MNTLYALFETDKNPDLIISVFKLKLLCFLGFMPRIAECVNCKQNENLHLIWKMSLWMNWSWLLNCILMRNWKTIIKCERPASTLVGKIAGLSWWREGFCVRTGDSCLALLRSPGQGCHALGHTDGRCAAAGQIHV